MKQSDNFFAEQSIPNPYLVIYQSYNYKVGQKSTKNDAQSIARHLGLIYNTFGVIVKDFISIVNNNFSGNQQKKFNRNIRKAQGFAEKDQSSELPKINPTDHIQIESIQLGISKNMNSEVRRKMPVETKLDKIEKTIEEHKKRTNLKNIDQFQIKRIFQHKNIELEHQPEKNNYQSELNFSQEKMKNIVIQLDEE